MRKFSDLISTLDQIKISASNRQYSKVSELVKTAKELIFYFQEYREVPQIEEVLSDHAKIISTLQLQIKDEFSLLLKGMSTQSDEVIKEAAMLGEVLGREFLDGIVKIVISIFTTEYKDTFDSGRDSSLSNIEKKFVWFSREIVDFRKKYLKYFPHHWGILCYIANEVCSLICVSTSEALFSLFYYKKKRS